MLFFMLSCYFVLLDITDVSCTMGCSISSHFLLSCPSCCRAFASGVPKAGVSWCVGAGWFLSMHISSTDKYLASALTRFFPSRFEKWFPVTGFINYCEYSGAGRVSLCCPTASGVSVGDFLTALCPTAVTWMDFTLEGDCSETWVCAVGSHSTHLHSVLGLPSAVLVLSILLMRRSIGFEHSSEHSLNSCELSYQPVIYMLLQVTYSLG